MNFTEKIAEQCNGAQQCDLSSQPTYIHKCGKISDYLYECINEESIYDVCKPLSRVFSRRSRQDGHGQVSFYLKSSDFPDEYPSSLDCSCAITSSTEQLKLEVLWFSLQDNDYLSLFNKNLTGWMNPSYEMPILTKSNTIRFLTDDSLAYKGFWLKISSRRVCRDDWQLVGDTCIKVFAEALDWRSANQRCQQMSGNLLKIDDVVSDLKLTQYMKSFYPEVAAYWIGLRKYVDQFNKERWMWSNNSTNYNDVSWWPWTSNIHVTQSTSAAGGHPKDSLTYPNNCVLKQRNEDGFFTTSCDSANRNSFICQTEPLAGSPVGEDIRLQCGSTPEVNKQLAELAQFEKIGVSSIQNYQTKPKVVPVPVKSNSILIQPDESIPQPTTLKAELLKQYFTAKPFHNQKVQHSALTTKIASESKLMDPQFNTNVLAGIISGIGLVIVVINLAVLFFCRRNLKKFLKSTKEVKGDQQERGQAPLRDEMLQEYFEAFNTLHTLGLANGPCNTSSKQLKLLSEINALTLGAQQQQQLNLLQAHTSSMNSGDESLMNESAKLFYNSQQFFKNMTLKQTEAALAKTSSSAFKPFIRELNEKTLSQQQLLQHNQYDKMSHVQAQQAHHFQQQKFVPPPDNQYAHTYECLDVVDPAKRAQFNYNGRANEQAANSLLQSPNTLMNELANSNNFNVSSSSTSSSSGASSTQQLIRNPHDSIMMSNNLMTQQLLTQAQLATLNELKLAIQNQQTLKSFICACGATCFSGVCGVCGNSNNENTTGSWSPDSAYYSSIPTLTNYAAYNMHANGVLNGNQHMQQQFTSFNFNNNPNGENFKSHLV